MVGEGSEGGVHLGVVGGNILLGLYLYICRLQGKVSVFQAHLIWLSIKAHLQGSLSDFLNFYFPLIFLEFYFIF